MRHLNYVDNKRYRYSRIIGTGGIGSGMCFMLEGNHTMGRNESRLGLLATFRDYCKLHIIFHYISILLNAGQDGPSVYPLGCIGDDAIGEKLVAEMKSAGMDIANIRVISEASTLFSVCYQYPDKTGGNITTSNSASNQLTTDDIDAFFRDFKIDGEGEIILAVPEVPVDTRLRLIEYGRKRGSFNAASVLSSEVDEYRKKGGFEKTDLLCVNIDEAGAICGLEPELYGSVEIVEKCTGILHSLNPDMKIVVTDGPHGCYGSSNGRIEYVPVCKVEAEGTAGAGDALMSGVITGMCCGLEFMKGSNDTFFSQTPLKSALELGTLIAALSVTSPDSIHMGINVESLLDFIKMKGIKPSSEFLKLFYDIREDGKIKDEL